MILTREEYEQIVRQKAKAESEAAVAKSNAAAAIEQADRDAQRKIREAAEETQEEINKIHQDLSEAESKIKYWQGLNENLLRISKERANADRKLKPKKEHTGYVVVSSTEKEYRYKVNRRDFETVMLWETVLQTPYPIDFTEEQAREETKELIGNDGRGNWLIARLGINMYYGGDYEDLLENSKWNDPQPEEHNIMFKGRLRANYRAGYWEIIFSHTKPLGIVPADMYDVPGKATDGTIMDDASETTYCFIICCICPVKKTSNDLGYNEKEAIFENLVRLEKVAPPENAFLFPSFDDRASNCHSLLYYSRRDMHAEFVANGLNCQLPLWEPDQKQYFQAAVDTAFSSQYTVETSIELYQNICEKAEELEDPTISKNGLHHILEQCGATEDDLNAFDREFPDNVVLHSNSIIDTRKCTISAYGMTLN